MLDILQAIFVGAIVTAVVWIAVDAYRIFRKRWLFDRSLSGSFPPSAAGGGIDASGELTVAAKYAIWNYMFSILAVGGTIIGIVSGIAGYMINGLATEKAIQVALNKMQAPLTDRLAQFADAKSALDVAAKEVANDLFKSAVATKLSDDSAFRGRIAQAVSSGEGLRKDVADLIFKAHASELRGPPGPPGPVGPPGRDGVNGTSPSVASVVTALDNSSLRTEVAQLLAARHVDQLRGTPGAQGPVGPPGRDGSNGVSPTPALVAAALNESSFQTSVAQALAVRHAGQLRGPQGVVGPAGLPGRDGANGTSPSAAEVAKAIVANHSDQLRGPVGAAGPIGPAGQNGVNGTSASAADIAKVVVSSHGQELRGPPGPVGSDGKPGASPSADEIALILVTKHRNDLRRLLNARYPGNRARGRVSGKRQ